MNTWLSELFKRDVDVAAPVIRYDCIEFSSERGLTFQLRGEIVETFQPEGKFVIYFPRAITLQPKDCCKRCSDEFGK